VTDRMREKAMEIKKLNKLHSPLRSLYFT